MRVRALLITTVALLLVAPATSAPAATGEPEASAERRVVPAATNEPPGPVPLLGRDRLLLMPYITRRAASPPRDVTAAGEAIGNHLKRISSGGYRVRSDVAPYVNIGGGGDPCAVSHARSWRLAAAAARRRGFDLSDYDYVWVFAECLGTPSPYAEPGGRRSWLEARRYLGWEGTLNSTLLLTNAGVPRDSGLTCQKDGVVTLLRGDCRVQEGDQTSFLGGTRIYTTGLSLPSMHRLGWAPDLRTVRRSGTFELMPPTGPTDDSSGLRIVAGDGVRYYVQPTKWIYADHKGTGALRLWRETANHSLLLRVFRAYPLLPFSRSAIPTHGSVTTPEGVRISATRRDDSSVEVQVSYGAEPPARPSPPPELDVQLMGERALVTWGHPDDQGAPVQHYRVTVPGTDFTDVVDPIYRWTYVPAPVGSDGQVHVTAINEYGASDPAVGAWSNDGTTPFMYYGSSSFDTVGYGVENVSIRFAGAALAPGTDPGALELYANGRRQVLTDLQWDEDSVFGRWDTAQLEDGWYEVVARIPGEQPLATEPVIISVENPDPAR